METGKSAALAVAVPLLSCGSSQTLNPLTRLGLEPQQSNDRPNFHTSNCNYSALSPAETTTTPRLWRPLSLHRRILACYLVWILCLLVATETIYQLSNERNGLVVAAEDRYYLWTYGPTASKPHVARSLLRLTLRSPYVVCCLLDTS